MRFKRLLALLLAAALALSLLAGCGGGRNQSLSQMLLNLLDGQYQNVSVEIDSDLEAKLRQAISESETDEELRAALEQLLGGGISFQRLGSGQQGDSAWTLIIYPGTDPNAAARSVYLDLDKVFAALPADGQYSSGFAMAEMENGYAILVRATVDKAGTEDKPDPVTLKSIAVTTPPTKTTYWVGEPFDPANMVITATYSNNTTKTISDITAADKKGVSWTPAGALATTNTSVTITYGEKTTTVSVTVEEPTVKSIEVSGYQDTYTEGELFTYSGNGMTVTVNYTYGAPKTITGIKTNGNQGVTWTPAGGLTTGTESVKITYTEAEKGSAFIDVPVTVNTKPATVTGIEVTHAPTKMTYISGEPFDPAGMTITATYSDGTKTAVNDYTWLPKTLSKGTTEVTISYGGQSTTVEVTILEGNNSYDAETRTYSIATADGLMAWNEAVQKDLTLNCILTENINLNDKAWTPIGSGFSSNTGYQGTFDGRGHSITGLNASSLFGDIGKNATVKNLQLVDVKLNESGGATAGIVANNYGTIMACSMTGEISAYSYTSGIANFNSGKIVACWFSGTLKENEGYGIVAFNYGTITACFWDGNTTNGYRSNEGGTVDATKVNDGDSWQTAVDGMNAALTGNDYQWKLGANSLPVLQRNQ